MRKLISIIVVVGLIIGLTSSTPISYPEASNQSFTNGEQLHYRVSYGFMDAGEAVLSVNKTTQTGANGRPLYHIKAVGKTISVFNWFYKVNDVYESYVDQQGAFPWYFKRNVNEGGYKINQHYTFKQNKNKVVTAKGKSYNVPLGVQDIISAFYYARTLDFNHMKKGDTKTVYCFLDGDIWPLKIKYMGRETIKIRAGTFRCMKFLPIVQKGHYFKDDEDVQFWVSDDENHVPILVKAKIPVGSIKMHLTEWHGLVGPLAKVN